MRICVSQDVPAAPAHDAPTARARTDADAEAGRTGEGGDLRRVSGSRASRAGSAARRPRVFGVSQGDLGRFLLRAVIIGERDGRACQPTAGASRRPGKPYMQIGGPGRPQVRRGAGWGYGLSGSQWERVSILRAVDPQVWLRAVRVAERGRDGRVKIAGKSAPKLGAVPRPRLPSASPLKTRFYMSPLAPTVPSASGLPPLPSLVAFYQVAKATRTAPASSRLHSPPLLSRSRYRSPSSTPHTEFTAKIFSQPFLILKTPMPRTFLAHRPFFSQLLTPLLS